MAESKNNIITHGLSGKIGDLIVFSSRNGKTIVGTKPKEHTGEQSEAQKLHHKRFQQAIIYAKVAINAPETKQIYNAGAKPAEGISSYNVAVADFLHAPDIKEIDLSNYSGKVGDIISIDVIDFKVVEVSVTIVNGDGTEVEHGLAQYDALKMQWFYTAKVVNESLDGDKIIIRASDVPGNVSEKEENI